MTDDVKHMKVELERDQRDVSDLWNDALKKYRGIVQVDLDKLPVPRFTSTEEMISYGSEQMEGFHRYRHNQQKVDKLRGLFRDSMWYIQKGAEQLAAAATPAFPPAAAISTAFSYMLNACKQVSADYDVVMNFFEDMNSFLQRITILESRLPSYPAYRNCLMDVFTSLLEMCAFATRYIREGRFKKWITNLIKGEDSDLGGARKKMDTSIDRLQSATEYAILGNTVEIQKMNAELRENQEAQTKMIETLLEKQDQMLTADAYFASYSKLLKLIEVQKDGDASRSKAKPAKGKVASANRVKNIFAVTTNPMVEHRNIKYSFLNGTCTWLTGEANWNSWNTQKSGVLTVSGPPGSGKSCLAAYAYDQLTASAEADANIIVASFYFREANKDFSSFVNAIYWIIIQIAEQDKALCEKILAETMREDDDLDLSDWHIVWTAILAPLFEEKSDSRLQLVLDGVDELDAQQRKLLIQFLNEIKEKHLNIAVLCTTRQNDMQELDALGGCSVVVDKDKMMPDMQKLMWNRLDHFDRLHKFSKLAKQKIAWKIEEKADSLLYVEHILRRYDTIGREGAVLKDMDRVFPENLEGLYDLMLSDCLRRTPPEQRETLRIIFVWLAYSLRPLTLELLTSLQTFTSQDNSYDIEEELQGRLSRILQLVEPTKASDEETNPKVSQLLRETEAIDGPIKEQDDSSLPVQFQERSLRGFFRPSKKIEGGLRTSYTPAHMSIFVTCSQILCSGDTANSESLRGYAAACWHSHFYSISGSELSDTDNISIVEALAAIMTNENNVSKTFEEIGFDYTALLAVWDEGKFEKGVVDWAASAVKRFLPRLSSNASAWVQSVVEDPQNAWIPLAKAHIKNWYQATDITGSMRSFRYAQSAILKTNLKHLVDKGKKNKSSEDGLEESYSKEEITAVKDAFGDIEPDAKAHWAIAVTFDHSGHHAEALTEAEAALSMHDDQITWFRTLDLKASIQLNLDNAEDAYKSISDALASDIAGIIPSATIREALVTRAKVEFKLGKFEAAAKSYEEARLACPGEILPGDILQATAKVFEANNDYVGLISMLKNWTSFDRITWLTWQYDDDDTMQYTFREAAGKTGEHDFMVKTYEEVIQHLDQFNAGAPLRSELVLAHKEVRKDLDAAKHVLNDILDSDSTGDLYAFTKADPSDVLYNTICDMSDIIYEQFRSTSDPKLKGTLLEEIKNLTQRNLAQEIASLKSELTHHTVVIATMLQKMGPILEFQDTLDGAFNACYEALSDSVGWNDSQNLVILATILARMTGLEKEAQIAVSALFSRLDPTLNDSADTEDNGSDDGSDAGSETSKLPTDEGDLTEDVEVACEGECIPPRKFHSWSGRSIYQCIVCNRCPLCEECYQKRQAYNRGEKSTNWRSYCGENHRYIRGPVKGWKGITDGVMAIEGEEPVSFKDWMTELKDVKWKKVWVDFWKNGIKDPDIV
ncbi:hypothetical protein BP6252_11215 [Coleophoma cylindrospora]|uniref:Fungal STAND N-terminal Goodbye domain-containing protein n=1 Tax=Coleophoma cylindrospora TaxID=1849047 RepID=A0A3D8QPV7_9HELO|nr:hypothetical protein BP6252_11215 [Coleophoma cylindrospora]